MGEFEQWAVASPEYLARRGKPLRPQQLSEHSCITFSAIQSASPTWRFANAAGAKVGVRIGHGLSCSSPLGVLALAKAGAGIASVAAPSAADDVTRGTLLRLFPEWRQPKAGVYAVYPTTKYVAPKTRAFIDFLRQRYTGWR